MRLVASGAIVQVAKDDFIKKQDYHKVLKESQDRENELITQRLELEKLQTSVTNDSMKYQRLLDEHKSLNDDHKRLKDSNKEYKEKIETMKELHTELTEQSEVYKEEFNKMKIQLENTQFTE